MIRITKFLVLLISCFSSSFLMAQKISNKGKDFWVGYGHHQFMETATDNSQNMTLYMSVEDLPAGVTYATVTVTIDSSGLTPALWWKRVYRIPKNTVISIDNSATPAYSFSPATTLSWGALPKGPVDATASHTSSGFDCRLYTDPCPAGTGGFGTFRRKAVHITSDYEIVAYSHIYGSVSSGATMLLPTTSWGYSYTTINSRQGDATSSYNFFYVLAQEDNTKVKITASQDPRANLSCSFTPPAKKTPFFVTLNKGQIFQYVGQANAAGNGVQLTASKVESVPNSLGQCKKIAVFSGSSRTSGENFGGCTSGGRDNDMVQCFPEHTWGRRYLTTPFADDAGATGTPSQFAGTNYKIVCVDTGTRVRINGGVNINIPKDSFYQFANSIPNYIESNKPIMVGQFMTSSNCGTGLGDPDMLYLSPLEQAIPKVGLYRNTQESITTQFVNIVVPDAGYSSLRIDNLGPPLFGGNSYTFQIPNYAGVPGLSGYKMVVKGWTATKSQTIVKCDTSFNIITYGMGGAESYSYNGGAYFNNLKAVPAVYNANDTTKNQDSINVKGHNQAYYSNQVASPVQLRLITGEYARILSWNFSQTVDTNKVTIVNKRTGFANTNVVDYHPKPIDSSNVNGKWTNFKYQCPDTMLLYQKNFNPVAPTKTDTFFVPVTIHNIDSVQLYTAPVNSCNGSYGSLGDTAILPYGVINGYGIQIIATPPSCKLDSTPFYAPDSVNYGIVREKIVSWFWEFEDGSTSTLKNLKRVLSKDTNIVYLTAITSSGLKVMTKDTVYAGLIVKFSAPDRVCVNQPIKLIDSTNRTNIDSCIWNFGNGIRISDPLCTQLTYTYTTAGTYVIWHTISIGSPCPIDTSFRTIVVSSKRYPLIEYTNPCADSTGLANLNANLGIGGVPIKNYLWNFGQPSSGASDSSKVNPTTHNYGVEGDFTVKLNIVDSLGCLGDTIQTIAIKIKPNIYFKPIPTNYCMNNGSLSFASLAGAYNQSKVLGYGIFKGPGIIDTTGNFDPKAAGGAGLKTIWYIYKSSKGCVDSLSRQINILDTPVVAFDYTLGCLPASGVAQFTNLTTLGFNFIWNFDDIANSSTSNPNIVDSINPSHVFVNTGLHNVKLYTESADGCKDSLTKAITFSVTPAVNFAPITSVCENAVNVNVALGSVSNNVKGMDSVYYGPGATSAGILSPAVSSWGTHTITYVYTSTGGCKDSASQTILVKARPKLGFTYPAGCLPANGIVQFTDTTKIPDGQTIQNCSWTFGDPNATIGNPNTASICSPSHNFNYGTYNIYHSVTSSLGCITDTTFNATFNISPLLFYNAIPDVCENLTSYSVAFAGSNNLTAAPGVGVYHGTGITNSATGDFNPSIAGYGTHTIWYVFSASSGCIDSISRTVNVKARPRGGFTFVPNTGCLDVTGLVQFSNNMTIQGSTIQSYNWKFEGFNSPIVNGISPTHNYNDGTDTILLNVLGANGCSFDTFRVETFNKIPALNPLVVKSLCENGGIDTIKAPLVTNGAVGTGSFSSFKNAIVNASLGTYDPSILGYGVDTVYYTYTSSSSLGCAATVQAPITINARPRGGFTFVPNTGCLDVTGFVQFSNNMTIQGSTIQSYSWKFEGFNSPVVNGASPTHNYNDGTDTILLNILGANGCSFDTFRVETFNKIPALNPLVVKSLCENGGIDTIKAPLVTNGAVGSGMFSSVKSAITNPILGIYDPSISGYGVDTVYYTYTSSSALGCAATVKAPITIKARPRGGFTFVPNTGCLDVTGLVKFSASGVTVPGSFVQTYNWQFENTLPPVSGGVAPNHNYSDGIYDIKLNAIGFNGCSHDTMITQQFSRTPSLDPIVFTNVCANTLPFALTAPNPTNGVIKLSDSFSSFYNAISSGNIYDPSKSLYIADTVYYTFTALSGCSTTIKKAVTIFPVPKAQINVKSDVCIDSTITFKDFSTLASGVIDTRNWNFGDGSLAVVNPIGNIISHNFPNVQSYTVKLTVTSDSGCVNTDSVDVTVRPKPTALFKVNPVVCMPNGTAFFTNQSTVAANGGTLSYAWSFGDPNATLSNPNTSSASDPVHSYSVIQTNPLKLVVTTKPYNCMDIFYDTLVVNKPFVLKPIAKFGVSKDTLCENEPTLFTDSSSSPNSSLFSWTWYYGDGSTPNTTTVPYSTYSYPVAGLLPAALTVRNTELCESDPYYLNVLVYPQPKIDSMNTIVVLQNTIVQFNPKVTDSVGVNYWWTAALPPYSVAGLSNPDSLRPYLTATQNQIFILNAVGDGNCKAERMQVVKVLGKIVIPNAFSPNGDGINDTWKITSLGDYPGATLDIFDRYGMKVVHLSGSIIEWDGTLNGVPMPVATYYYIINPGNGLAPITGWVVLIR